ncbi:unnamed protein product [Linum tenue]|uniref:Uncharacterized protein n=1 Tax=Linum tenue TaxID=586396 RepID=A0AAV0KU54_9ROSI|nr:unnamed protein product [Linum tenue]
MIITPNSKPFSSPPFFSPFRFLLSLSIPSSPARRRRFFTATVHISLRLCPTSSIVGYVLDRDCRCSSSNAKLVVTLHLLPQAWHCEGIDGEDNDHPHLPGKDDDPSPLPTLAILPFPATTTMKNLRCSEGVSRCKNNWPRRRDRILECLEGRGMEAMCFVMKKMG